MLKDLLALFSEFLVLGIEAIQTKKKNKRFASSVLLNQSASGERSGSAPTQKSGGVEALS